MDIWERCVRKAVVNRSKLAIRSLNLSYEDRKNPAILAEIGEEARGADACLRLAILLLKLNSKSSKAIEWASGLTQAPEDAA